MKELEAQVSSLQTQVPAVLCYMWMILCHISLQALFHVEICMCAVGPLATSVCRHNISHAQSHIEPGKYHCVRSSISRLSARSTGRRLWRCARLVHPPLPHAAFKDQCPHHSSRLVLCYCTLHIRAVGAVPHLRGWAPSRPVSFFFGRNNTFHCCRDRSTRSSFRTTTT